ncbi:MAG: glycosyltransferase family 1 protein [Elusimicrobiota bacterium]
MKIGIDARPLATTQYTGIGVYLKNVLDNLPEEALDPANTIYLYAQKKIIYPGLPANFSLRFGNGGMYGSVWVQTVLPFMIKKDNLDVFWGPLHVLPLLTLKRIRKVLTLHDFVYKRFPETMASGNMYIHKFLVAPSIKQADFIISDSKSTEDDLRGYFPTVKKPMKVIPPAVSLEFKKIGKSDAKKLVSLKFGLDRPYILAVGTQEPRKNFITAFNAFKNLSGRIPHLLVSTGKPGWKTGGMMDLIRQSEVAERIRFLGYVDKEDLPCIYSAADAFVFPSIYEGFGLPVLEAMACGCPVICSDSSSIPEVAGSAAIMLPPLDTDAWIKTIEKVISDERLCAELSAKGIERAREFNWKNTSQDIWNVFKTEDGR